MAEKYARDEFERRFLVEGEMPPVERTERITDRYLLGTRLRLRRMEAPTGPILKLAKISDVAVGHKKLTNLYLTEEEAALLSQLPARTLTKLRHVVPHDGRRWIIDEFENGLRIAEIEHAKGETVNVPPWCGEEVTDRVELSGYSLSTPDS